MKLRTLVTLLVVALLVVPGASLAAVRGSPELTAHLSDNTVVPGERTTLEVVLLNDGRIESGSATNPSLNEVVTRARGVTVDVGNGGSPLSVKTGTQAAGSIPEGTSKPIPFEVVVPEDAEAGTYNLAVTVTYSYTDYIETGDTDRGESSVRRTFDVTVRVG